MGGAPARPLRVGETVQEGAFLSTSSDGYLQVTLSDRSVLSLGPNSNIKLEPVRAQAVPAITMLRGQLKTAVPPAPLPSRVRLLIRTRSAVMGVRGTEFQVLYNATNEVTSVVTFEGSVAMTKNTGANAESLLTASAFQASAGQASSGADVVLVTPGNFSTLSLQATLPTIPQKISPLQLESLRRDRTTAVVAPSRGVLFLPPGLDARAASTQPLKDAPGHAETLGGPPPEGFIDKKTGATAPAAGGYLDLKTALYIPPPPGSAFDAQTGVFIPPASFGSLDSKSGDYIPPSGFTLDPKKGFVPDKTERPDKADDRGARGNSSAPKPVAGLPGTGLPPAGNPEDAKGIPGWFQPTTPVTDPFCPACAPPPPPVPPPSTNTLVKFNVTVQ